MKHSSYKKGSTESYDRFLARVFESCLKHMDAKEAYTIRNTVNGLVKAHEELLKRRQESRSD